MEIVDIETEQALDDVTPETSDEPLRWLYTFVRVHTDEGITGVGEATVPLLERAAAMAELRRVPPPRKRDHYPHRHG